MSNMQFGPDLARIRNFAIVSAALVVASFVVAHPASAEGSKPWSIQSLTGDVQVKMPGGKWMPAKQGAEIAPGAELKTAATGRAVVTQGGDVVEASPDSGASFPLHENKTMPSVIQNAGTLLYKIVTRPEDRFNVRTPYLTAVIKGTVFSVTVNNEGGALHVTRGAVEVTSRLTGEIAMVNPGQTAAVSSRPGLRLQLLGTQNGSKTESKSDAATSASAKKGSSGRVLGSPVGAKAANGVGKGLARNVGAGKTDVFSASKGLIGASGQTGPGSSPGNSDRSIGNAVDRSGANSGSFSRNSVAPAARGSTFSASNGGNGNGNAGGSGNGNAGGSGNGNAGGSGNGNAGGNGNGHGNPR